MRFNLATIHVSDFDASLHFYHDLLGLPIVRKFQGGSGPIAMLGQENQPQLELVGFGKPEGQVGAGLSIGFAVDNLDETMARLEGQVPPFKGPVSPNPHVRFAFTADPDGYTVQLLENI